MRIFIIVYSLLIMGLLFEEKLNKTPAATWIIIILIFAVAAWFAARKDLIDAYPKEEDEN